MKTLLTIMAALGIFAGIASAQSYQPNTITGIPTTQSADTNLATPVVIDVRRQKDVAISATLTSTAPGATNQYLLGKSVDGSKYDTNTPFTVWATTPNGAERTTVTNITVSGFGYLVLYRLDTTGSEVLTNSLKFGVKTQAP